MSLSNRLLRFLQPKAKAVQMPIIEAINQFRIASIAKLDQSLCHDATQLDLLKDLTVSVLGSRWLLAPDALVSRREFGHWLNWNGLVGQGVEVGVLHGGFSKQLLDTWQGKTLSSIDPWREFAADEYVDVANQPQSKQDENFRATQALLKNYGGRSSIIRKTSVEAAGSFGDGSLDFVYLDAQHHYEAVRDDMAIWYPKIKSGGVLGGHDYLDGIVADSLFGVKQAVDEFSAANGLHVIVTREPEFKSWFIRKP